MVTWEQKVLGTSSTQVGPWDPNHLSILLLTFSFNKTFLVLTGSQASFRGWVS